MGDKETTEKTTLSEQEHVALSRRDARGTAAELGALSDVAAEIGSAEIAAGQQTLTEAGAVAAASKAAEKSLMNLTSNFQRTSGFVSINPYIPIISHFRLFLPNKIDSPKAGVILQDSPQDTIRN